MYINKPHLVTRQVHILVYYILFGLFLQWIQCRLATTSWKRFQFYSSPLRSVFSRRMFVLESLISYLSAECASRELIAFLTRSGYFLQGVEGKAKFLVSSEELFVLHYTILDRLLDNGILSTITTNSLWNITKRMK